MSLIPKSFELGGCTYTVEITDIKPEGTRDSTTGTIIYPINKIMIYSNHTGYICTDNYKESSFYHEMVHGILATMGKSDLNDDEDFVEGFANILHQVIKTSKYE